MSIESLVKEVGRLAIPLKEAGDLRRLVDRISKARVVMLGEATHGTHEFYEWRRNISELLISQHVFNFIALEGDWPAAQQLNKRILAAPKHTGGRPAVADVLREAFTRWPTWMWANRETEALLEWISDFNSNVADSECRRRVRFFGLDVYSLFDSIQVVIEELDKVDKELAERARRHYACFDPSDRNEEEYMITLLEVPEGCKSSALKVLRDVLRRQMDNATEEEVFNIQQNAKIVSDADEYYRAVLFGHRNSWNVRENHMMDTLAFLLDRWPGGKAIVWAHNTHVGDYRATTMVNFGEVNLGGLVRQKCGQEAVALVGFGSYQGSVIASDRWGGSVQSMPVPPAREGSYEDIFHIAAGTSGNNHFYVIAREDEEAEGNKTLAKVRGHRAIGVVYNPEKERGNYVPTSLSGRFMVDSIPIRTFPRMKSLEAIYPSKPMSVYATIWDASSWTTDGGRYKANYSYHPFLATYTNFITVSCLPVLKDELYNLDNQYCSQGRVLDCNFPPELNQYQLQALDVVQKNYMVYDYCQDFRRYPKGSMPECSAVPTSSITSATSKCSINLP